MPLRPWFRGEITFRHEEGLKLCSLLYAERKNEDETKYRPNNNDIS